MNYASINRYSLTSLTDVVGVRGGQGTGRLILRFTADTRLAFSDAELDFNYIVFKTDTTVILDPPNLLSTTDLFFRLDSASSGEVELLRC